MTMDDIIHDLVSAAVKREVQPLIEQLKIEKLRVLSISEAEAARKIGVSAQHLTNLRISGRGPAFCMVGARILYRIVDLDDYLKAQRSKNTTEAQRKKAS